MKAGFAKVQINIKKKLELTGFERGRFAKRTLDGIFCKSILLEDKNKIKILFLSIDLLFIGKSLSKKFGFYHHAHPETPSKYLAPRKKISMGVHIIRYEPQVGTWCAGKR